MQIYSDVNKWRSQRISHLQRKSAQIFCLETRPAVPFFYQSVHVCVRRSHKLLRALSTCTERHKSGRMSTTEPPPRCHLLARVCQSATRLSHGLKIALPVFTHEDASDMEPYAASSPVVTRAERLRKISLQTTRSAEANL